MKAANIGRDTAVCFAFALALAGCSNVDQREKFVGTWHRVPAPKETVTVTKEGSKRLAFVAHDYTSPEPQIGELAGDQVVFNAFTTAVLREDGHMMYDGREYTK